MADSRVEKLARILVEYSAHIRKGDRVLIESEPVAFAGALPGAALALLNRGFEVYVDEPAMLLDELAVSAGQRGLNLRLGVEAFLAVTGARWLDAGREAAGAE